MGVHLIFGYCRYLLWCQGQPEQAVETLGSSADSSPKPNGLDEKVALAQTMATKAENGTWIAGVSGGVGARHKSRARRYDK